MSALKTSYMYKFPNRESRLEWAELIQCKVLFFLKCFKLHVRSMVLVNLQQAVLIEFQ